MKTPSTPLMCNFCHDSACTFAIVHADTIPASKVVAEMNLHYPGICVIPTDRRLPMAFLDQVTASTETTTTVSSRARVSCLASTMGVPRTNATVSSLSPSPYLSSTPDQSQSPPHSTGTSPSQVSSAASLWTMTPLTSRSQGRSRNPHSECCSTARSTSPGCST